MPPSILVLFKGSYQAKVITYSQRQLRLVTVALYSCTEYQKYTVVLLVPYLKKRKQVSFFFIYKWMLLLCLVHGLWGHSMSISQVSLTLEILRIAWNTLESTIWRGRYFHHLRKCPADAPILAVNVFCAATRNSEQACDTSLQASVNDIVLKAGVITLLSQ